MSTPFLVCIVDSAGKGSMVARRKTLHRAKAAASQLVDTVRRPLGIWDSTRDAYVFASFMPAKGGAA